MGWLEDKAREQAFLKNARDMQATAKEGAEVNVDESDDPEIIIIDDLPDTEGPEDEEAVENGEET